MLRIFQRGEKGSDVTTELVAEKSSTLSLKSQLGALDRRKRLHAPAELEHRSLLRSDLLDHTPHAEDSSPRLRAALATQRLGDHRAPEQTRLHVQTLQRNTHESRVSRMQARTNGEMADAGEAGLARTE